MVQAKRDPLRELQALPHPPPAAPLPAQADLVRLASNESPWGASPAVKSALADALREGAPGLHRYPADGGGALREALALRHAVAPDEVMVGNGSTELLALIAQASLRAGGSAVFAPASFVYYGMATRMAGGEPVESAAHTAEALLAATRPDTRVLFLAQPGNPSGALLPREELEWLVDALPAEILLVVDQAYADYEDPLEYPDAVRLLRRRERLAVLHTFSKLHGLAALRVGHLIAAREVVAALERVRPPFNVGALAQVAALAALGDLEHPARVRALNLEARRELLVQAQLRGLTAQAAHGNFALVAGPLPGAELAEALASRGILVQPQRGPLARFVRVTLGRPEELAHFWSALDELRR